MEILRYAVTALYVFAALSSQGFSRDLAKPIDPKTRNKASTATPHAYPQAVRQ